MFESLHQSFEDRSAVGEIAGRMARLRAELARRGLDGWIAPRSDEYQNEYVPPGAERLAWLTGFSGSAGVCVVLPDRAALFVDGRYTLQAPEQVDPAVVTVVALAETTPEAWIEANAKKGARIGFDPWLHTAGGAKRLAAAAEAAGARLEPVEANPVDAVWSDRPPAPLAPVRLHPAKWTGETAGKKAARVQAELKGADALLVSDPHAVAWLFNIRGGDVRHTPLPLARALVPATGRPTLYVDGRKLSNAVRAALEDVADVAEPAALEARLVALGRSGAKLRIDADTAPARLARLYEDAGGRIDSARDPIATMKAKKNRAELDGARRAQLDDAVGVTRFLAWFDATAPKGRLTEIEATQALETFRREAGALRDISFPTIAGAGPNAAIPHYRVSETSNRRIGRGLFLIDSGGQYEAGTTDITRTIAVGRPTAEMRDRCTRVLKGHIAIARAVFPAGTTGAQLDSFARAALWEAGLDFDHGTGHGVGAYLSVHEGPQRISKLGHTPLEAGMILSNEPAYYKPGAWGVRIENLIVVEPRTIRGAERRMLGFETITLAPIDLRLVDARLMTPDEIAWLDAYHARVRRLVGPRLDRPTRAWLAAATRRLAP